MSKQGISKQAANYIADLLQEELEEINVEHMNLPDDAQHALATFKAVQLYRTFLRRQIDSLRMNGIMLDKSFTFPGTFIEEM